MADLVIRGMEMPTEQRIEVLIFKNGFVAYYDVEGRYIGQAKAVPIPEGHGRLVDAEEIRTRLSRKLTACKPGTIEELTFAVIIDIVDHADTIVPAEGGNADG